MDSQFLGALLITLVVFVGIFLLCREFFCWYWKINEHLAERKRGNAIAEGTNQLLRAMLEADGMTDPDARAKFIAGLWQ